MQTKRWKFTRIPEAVYGIGGWFVQLGTYPMFTDKLEWSTIGYVHKESGKWYAGYDSEWVTPYKTRRDAAEAEIKAYIGI